MKRSLCCPREPSRVDEVDVTPGPTLRIGGGSDDEEATVPAPVPPADPDAWYAPDVRAQYESAPGVVATIRSLETGGFAYDVREPHLSPADERALDAVRAHFASTRGRRPLTRAGAIELAATGFEPKYARVLDRLLAVSDAARRRLDYHALRALRLFGDLTPIALDDRIAVADVGDDEELIVHTGAFAPLGTGGGADAPFIERVAGERLARYTVAFAGFSVDVVVYRERLLGSDAFEIKYAALEPDLLPGDESLIRECKRRIWETPVDHVIDDHGRFVADHARRYLSRRLTERHPRGLLDRAASRLRRLVPGRRPRPPTRGPPAPADRIDDLVGTTYQLSCEEPGTVLRDVSEFSTLLNATARYERADVGLAVCLGDREEAFDRARTLLRNHRKNLSEGVDWVTSEGVTMADNVQWFDAGDEIRETIVGIIAGMAVGESGIRRDRPIIGFAEKSETETKVSARGSHTLTADGLDLSVVMREAARAVDGDGGGHDVAAGATIPTGTQKAFIDAADEIVGEQLSS
mgnify:CR=1 FL=1